MSYSWIYYGRKVRRVALFSIKLIDFFYCILLLVNKFIYRLGCLFCSLCVGRSVQEWH